MVSLFWERNCIKTKNRFISACCIRNMWVIPTRARISQITSCTLANWNEKLSYLSLRWIIWHKILGMMTSFLQIFLGNKQWWVYCLTLPEKLCWYCISSFTLVIHRWVYHATCSNLPLVVKLKFAAIIQDFFFPSENDSFNMF